MLAGLNIELNNMEEVVTDLNNVIRIQPDHVAAHYNRGVALQKLKRLEESENSYREAIRLQPDYALAHAKLCHALRELGEYDEAAKSCQQAVNLKPQFADAHNMLGLVLLDQKKFDAAESCFKTALGISPQDSSAHYNLGLCNLTQEKFGPAKACYEQALQINPNFADAINDLGLVLKEEEKPEQARHQFERALAIEPKLAMAHNNLGNVLMEMGEFEASHRSYEKALKYSSDRERAEIHYCQGSLLYAQGKHQEAVGQYRRALELKPDYEQAQENLCFTLIYCPSTRPEVLLEEHIRWARNHAAHLAPEVTKFDNRPDPDRRLRVGYVSPDFKAHSVSFFFEPLLNAHNREAVETYCYAEVKRPDEFTRRIRGAAEHWCDTVGLSDEELAQKIRADGIDILVDLAGHSAFTRLLVFAYKPAPVQVSYLGYPATTGLPEVDYRITDAWADPPPESDRHYTEKLIRLCHGFLCYQASSQMPPVGPSPAKSNGYVTFGSFNNGAKISQDALTLWASILRAVPDSRLIVKNKYMRDKNTQENYRNLFREQGVDGDRLEFLSQVYATEDHFAIYNRVDIGLDTFPYNGTTITCENLWMGVPVIALAGCMHAGRVGVSLLSQVELTELIAEDHAAYARIAAALAGDPERLCVLRTGMRERMERSPLFDSAAMAVEMEAAYRAMWKDWCAGVVS